MFLFSADPLQDPEKPPRSIDDVLDLCKKNSNTFPAPGTPEHGILVERINILSETFDATSYLSWVHKNDPYSEAKEWPKRINELIRENEEAQKETVNRYIGKYFLCQSSLQEIQTTLSELIKPGVDSSLTNTLTIAQEQAQHLLNHVLSLHKELYDCKDQLNRLKRFSFVFNLPKTLKDNIREGDYQNVVRLLKTEKWLRGQFESPVISSILQEIDSSVLSLRTKLKAQVLTSFYPDFHEIFDTLDLLHTLEMHDNPLHFFIRGRLAVCVRGIMINANKLLELLYNKEHFPQMPKHSVKIVTKSPYLYQLDIHTMDEIQKIEKKEDASDETTDSGALDVDLNQPHDIIIESRPNSKTAVNHILSIFKDTFGPVPATQYAQMHLCLRRMSAHLIAYLHTMLTFLGGLQDQINHMRADNVAPDNRDLRNYQKAVHLQSLYVPAIVHFFCEVLSELFHLDDTISSGVVLDSKSQKMEWEQIQKDRCIAARFLMGSESAEIDQLDLQNLFPSRRVSNSWNRLRSLNCLPDAVNDEYDEYSDSDDDHVHKPTAHTPSTVTVRKRKNGKPKLSQYPTPFQLTQFESRIPLLIPDVLKHIQLMDSIFSMYSDFLQLNRLTSDISRQLSWLMLNESGESLLNLISHPPPISLSFQSENRYSSYVTQNKPFALDIAKQYSPLFYPHSLLAASSLQASALEQEIDARVSNSTVVPMVLPLKGARMFTIKSLPVQKKVPPPPPPKHILKRTNTSNNMHLSPNHVRNNTSIFNYASDSQSEVISVSSYTSVSDQKMRKEWLHNFINSISYPSYNLALSIPATVTLFPQSFHLHPAAQTKFISILKQKQEQDSSKSAVVPLTNLFALFQLEDAEYGGNRFVAHLSELGETIQRKKKHFKNTVKSVYQRYTIEESSFDAEREDDPLQAIETAPSLIKTAPLGSALVAFPPPGSALTSHNSLTLLAQQKEHRKKKKNRLQYDDDDDTEGGSIVIDAKHGLWQFGLKYLNEVRDVKEDEIIFLAKQKPWKRITEIHDRRTNLINELADVLSGNVEVARVREVRDVPVDTLSLPVSQNHSFSHRRMNSTLSQAATTQTMFDVQQKGSDHHSANQSQSFAAHSITSSQRLSLLPERRGTISNLQFTNPSFTTSLAGSDSTPVGKSTSLAPSHPMFVYPLWIENSSDPNAVAFFHNPRTPVPTIVKKKKDEDALPSNPTTPGLRSAYDNFRDEGVPVPDMIASLNSDIIEMSEYSTDVINTTHYALGDLRVITQSSNHNTNTCPLILRLGMYICEGLLMYADSMHGYFTEISQYSTRHLSSFPQYGLPNTVNRSTQNPPAPSSSPKASPPPPTPVLSSKHTAISPANPPPLPPPAPASVASTTTSEKNEPPTKLTDRSADDDGISEGMNQSVFTSSASVLNTVALEPPKTEQTKPPHSNVEQEVPDSPQTETTGLRVRPKLVAPDRYNKMRMVRRSNTESPQIGSDSEVSEPEQLQAGRSPIFNPKMYETDVHSKPYPTTPSFTEPTSPIVARDSALLQKERNKAIAEEAAKRTLASMGYQQMSQTVSGAPKTFSFLKKTGVTKKKKRKSGRDDDDDDGYSEMSDYVDSPNKPRSTLATTQLTQTGVNQSSFTSISSQSQPQTTPILGPGSITPQPKPQTTLRVSFTHRPSDSEERPRALSQWKTDDQINEEDSAVQEERSIADAQTDTLSVKNTGISVHIEDFFQPSHTFDTAVPFPVLMNQQERNNYFGNLMLFLLTIVLDVKERQLACFETTLIAHDEIQILSFTPNSLSEDENRFFYFGKAWTSVKESFNLLYRLMFDFYFHTKADDLITLVTRGMRDKTQFQAASASQLQTQTAPAMADGEMLNEAPYHQQKVRSYIAQTFLQVSLYFREVVHYVEWASVAIGEDSAVVSNPTKMNFPKPQKSLKNATKSTQSTATSSDKKKKAKKTGNTFDSFINDLMRRMFQTILSAMVSGLSSFALLDEQTASVILAEIETVNTAFGCYKTKQSDALYTQLQGLVSQKTMLTQIIQAGPSNDKRQLTYQTEAAKKKLDVLWNPLYNQALNSLAPFTQSLSSPDSKV